jgi:hypothetical protein
LNIQDQNMIKIASNLESRFFQQKSLELPGLSRSETSSSTEKSVRTVNLEELVISKDELKRFFLIMLPGKVVLPEKKGYLIDIIL